MLLCIHKYNTLNSHYLSHAHVHTCIVHGHTSRASGQGKSNCIHTHETKAVPIGTRQRLPTTKPVKILDWKSKEAIPVPFWAHLCVNTCMNEYNVCYVHLYNVATRGQTTGAKNAGSRLYFTTTALES